jgi:type II secretory pathway component GspD/PulD (secretin)
MAVLLSTALFSASAFGQQAVTRTYSFTHVENFQELQQMTGLLRTLTSINQITMDSARLSTTMGGTAEQIGITDWLFRQLDQPPQGPAPLTYNVSVDDVVELMYLPSTLTVQEFQEVANCIRTVVEIPLAFGLNSQRALAIRAPAAQVVLAAKLVSDLTQAPPTASIRVYPSSAGADDVTQVYFLTHTESIQDFQETANAVRTITEIRRIVADNAPRAIVARGTAAQLAMATWLLHDLDQPQTAPAAHSYYGPTPEETIRVFYLPAALGTVREFQNAATKIRTAAQLRRAVALNTQRAFVVRGTISEVSRVNQMVQDLKQ